MKSHVSLWDDPSEQQQTNSAETKTGVTTTVDVEGEPATSVDASTGDMNPVQAAVAASSWSRDDIELALQVLNLLLLMYFVLKWREQNV